MELNGAVSFPIALYEAYDDVVTYLEGHRHRHARCPACGIPSRSPDVKGTYQGSVIPRQAAGPTAPLVDAKPAYDSGNARPRARRCKSSTPTLLQQHKLDALVFPHRA